MVVDGIESRFDGLESYFHSHDELGDTLFTGQPPPEVVAEFSNVISFEPYDPDDGYDLDL